MYCLHILYPRTVLVSINRIHVSYHCIVSTYHILELVSYPHISSVVEPHKFYVAPALAPGKNFDAAPASTILSVAELHHFYAAPAPGKKFDAVPAPVAASPAPAPTLLSARQNF
jgi:hypothetical protein